MSAPSIPNLSTFRTRTGLRGRGRGRGRPDSLSTGSSSPAASSFHPKGDAAIQQTDNDAVSARWSAVKLGYLDDNFIDQLITKGTPERRYPIINRGTYVRTKAIDILVEKFLTSRLNATSDGRPHDDVPRAQIISLGAGSDTRPFRLLQKYGGRGLVYHETDFASNTRDKISAIRSSTLLQQAAGLDQFNAELAMSDTTLSSRRYHIHALDLREIGDLCTNLALAPNTPTLILSECCLCYLDADSSASLLKALIAKLDPITPAALIVYEPIRPQDPFGQTMVSNLASRGICMPSMAVYPDLDAQRQRMLDIGLGKADAVDVEGIYYSDMGKEPALWLGQDERARVEGLEWLDEVEEWRLLASHYCVAWGWRDGRDDVFGRAWTGLGATSRRR